MRELNLGTKGRELRYWSVVHLCGAGGEVDGSLAAGKPTHRRILKFLSMTDERRHNTGEKRPGAANEKHHRHRIRGAVGDEPHHLGADRAEQELCKHHRARRRAGQIGVDLDRSGLRVRHRESLRNTRQCARYKQQDRVDR